MPTRRTPRTVTLSTLAFGLFLVWRGATGGNGTHPPALYFALAAICAAVALREIHRRLNR